jgi:hypothetical protein
MIVPGGAVSIALVPLISASTKSFTFIKQFLHAEDTFSQPYHGAHHIVLPKLTLFL